MPTPRRLTAAVLAVAGALSGAAANADPGYYVLRPYDQAVTTTEPRYWTVRAAGGAKQVWPELAGAVLFGSTYAQHGRMVTLRVAASF